MNGAVSTDLAGLAQRIQGQQCIGLGFQRYHIFSAQATRHSYNQTCLRLPLMKNTFLPVMIS